MTVEHLSAQDMCMAPLDYIIKLEQFARRLAEYPSKTQLNILVKEVQDFWEEVDKEVDKDDD